MQLTQQMTRKLITYFKREKVPSYADEEHCVVQKLQTVLNNFTECQENQFSS